MKRKGYVVLRANGEVEVKPYEGVGEDSFFGFVKANDIHCETAEPIRICNGIRHLPSVYFLGNENGYAELGDDPSNVNVIGTWLYNETYSLPEVSYVLGDLVLCTEEKDENGDLDFAPFSSDIAEMLAKMAKGWKTIAEEKYPRPGSVPSPFVSIQTFDSIEEMMKAIGRGA